MHSDQTSWRKFTLYRTRSAESFLAGKYTNSYWSCLRNWLGLSAILLIALTIQAETKQSGHGKPEFFVAQGTLRQILAPGMPTISEKKRTGRFDFLLEKKGGVDAFSPDR
jgi:hypothetical protein